MGQFLPGEPAEILQGLFERKPEDVPTDFDLLHGAMHKFLFYSGAWSTHLELYFLKGIFYGD